MTEHVQLELIAAIIVIAGQIITAWRANTAATKQSSAIEQVHQSVNGGMAAQKKEIASLKAEVLRLNTLTPEQRLEEIRGQNNE